MSLFLLGIPCAIISGVMLKNDVKYTTKDIRIQKADIELEKQYKQIDRQFIDILDYCGAKGDIYRDGNQKKIKNTKLNEYGAMRKYLAQKGYYSQAIDYAINKYNKIAKKEQEQCYNERDKRIQNFEYRLKTEPSEYCVINITAYNQQPKYLVERDIEKILQYLHTHGHEKAYCNITMGGNALHHNHIETWHLKTLSSNPKLVDQYIIDIEEKILLGDD